jgi:hypothetical protein
MQPFCKVTKIRRSPVAPASVFERLAASAKWFGYSNAAVPPNQTIPKGLHPSAQGYVEGATKLVKKAYPIIETTELGMEIELKED